MSPPNELGPPGIEVAAPPKNATGKLKSVKVRMGQITIPIYPLKRRGWQFRYCAGKKPIRKTCATIEAAKAARVATGLENGRVTTENLSAAEAQSYFHAVRELQKLPDLEAPPLHVALADYVSAKSILAAGVSLAEAVRGFLRYQPDTSNAMLPDILEKFLTKASDTRRQTLGIRSGCGAWSRGCWRKSKCSNAYKLSSGFGDLTRANAVNFSFYPGQTL